MEPLAPSMRVLITNNALAVRAGSELYVRDLALALLRRGHTPIAFSTDLGEIARELRAATVPVVDDLNDLGAPPDIIHGHHHLDTMTALLHFDRTPAIYFCHGWTPWQEAPPPRSPRIFRYVAVDDTCRDRLVFQHGIPEAQVQVVLNFVDLARFRPRSPLPKKPARALIFSNNFSDGDETKMIREACAGFGIALDVIGMGSGHACSAPETRLGDYDLVFAKARAALEALAVGNAVVVCDKAGLGGMVTAENLAEHRRLNFGIRQLREPVTVERVAREVRRYDRSDAAEVSARIRAEAGLEPAIDRLLSIYREVIVEAGAQREFDRSAEAKATSGYLRWLSPILKSRQGAEARAAQGAHQAAFFQMVAKRMAEERLEIEKRIADQAEQIETLTRHAADRDTLEALSKQLTQSRDAAQGQLDQISASRAWRWISRYERFRQRWLSPGRS